jgi:SulP family sulfate permease
VHELAEIPHVLVYDVDGPLFFGAAYKALKTLLMVDKATRAVVLDMRDVSMVDVTAMMTIESIIHELAKRNTLLVFCHVRTNVMAKLQRYGISGSQGNCHFAADMPAAAAIVRARLGAP